MAVDTVLTVGMTIPGQNSGSRHMITGLEGFAIGTAGRCLLVGRTGTQGELMHQQTTRFGQLMHLVRRPGRLRQLIQHIGRSRYI